MFESKEILGMIYNSIANTLVYLSSYTKECANVTLQQLTTIFQINICKKFTRNNPKISVILRTLPKICLQTLNTLTVKVGSIYLNNLAGV